jgi:hypothetical protein
MVTPADSSSSSSPSPSCSQHVQQDAREARYRSLKQTLEDAGRGFMRQVDTVTNDAEAALRLATSEPERQQIAADRDAAYRLAYEEYHEVLIQTCRADSRLLHHPFAQTQWILARAVGAREFLERLPGGLARGVRPALTPQESELVHVVERLRWTRCDGCGNLVTVQQPPEPEAQLTVAWLGETCATDTAVLEDLRRSKRDWRPYEQDGAPVPCRGRLVAEGGLVDLVKSLQAQAGGGHDPEHAVQGPAAGTSRFTLDGQHVHARLVTEPQTPPERGLRLSITAAVSPARSLWRIYSYLAESPALRHLLVRPGETVPMTWPAFRGLVGDGVADRGNGPAPLGSLHQATGAWAPERRSSSCP